MCVCDQGPPTHNGTVGGVSRTAQVHSGPTKIAVGSILGYYKFSKMWGKRTGPLGHSVRSYNPPVPSRPQRRPLPLGGLLLYLSIFTRLQPTLQFSASALSIFYSSSASPLFCFCDIRDREASAVINQMLFSIFVLAFPCYRSHLGRE